MKHPDSEPTPDPEGTAPNTLRGLSKAVVSMRDDLKRAIDAYHRRKLNESIAWALIVAFLVLNSFFLLLVYRTISQLNATLGGST